MKTLHLAILLCFTVGCYARPDGAPPSACSTLTPAHSGIRPQTSDPPFTVSAIKSGNKVTVTLSSPSGVEFEGFILQARSRNDPSKFIDGEFTSSQVAKATDCFEGKKNTLTQVGATPKNEIVTEWTPKGSVTEDVIFRATIAQTFAMFWTKIDSSPVKMSEESSSPGATEGPHDSIFESCFEDRGCIGLPEGCVQKKDCKVLFTYKKLSSGIRLALHGVLNSSNYMAMGLSYDALMGEDSVTECVRDGTNIVMRRSWNEGRSNTRSNFLSQQLQDSMDVRTSFADGVASCSWTTPLLTTIYGQDYDLANKKYFVLLAWGVSDSGDLKYHTGRMSSNEAVNFNSYDGEHEEKGVSVSVKVNDSTEPRQTEPPTDEHEAKATDDTESPAVSETVAPSCSSRFSWSSFLITMFGLGLTVGSFRLI